MIKTLNNHISRDKCLHLVSAGSIWYDSNKNAGFTAIPSVYCLAIHKCRDDCFPVGNAGGGGEIKPEGRRSRLTLESFR